MIPQQWNILLVDEDYESMRDLMEYLTERLPCRVALTAAAELLERLGQERFDLITVDMMIHPVSLDAQDEEVHNIHFPNVNWQRTGLEFIRRLRRGEFRGPADQGTPPDVPLLILSAVASSSLEDDLIKEDIAIQGYVEKPFHLDQLIARIRKILQELGYADTSRGARDE